MAKTTRKNDDYTGLLSGTLRMIDNGKKLLKDFAKAGVMGRGVFADIAAHTHKFVDRLEKEAEQIHAKIRESKITKTEAARPTKSAQKPRARKRRPKG